MLTSFIVTKMLKIILMPYYLISAVIIYNLYTLFVKSFERILRKGLVKLVLRLTFSCKAMYKKYIKQETQKS